MTLTYCILTVAAGANVVSSFGVCYLPRVLPCCIVQQVARGLADLLSSEQVVLVPLSLALPPRHLNRSAYPPCAGFQW